MTKDITLAQASKRIHQIPSELRRHAAISGQVRVMLDAPHAIALAQRIERAGSAATEAGLRAEISQLRRKIRNDRIAYLCAALIGLAIIVAEANT